MINNVTLIGRLTKDVELKRTPSDIAAAQFTIACNRNFKNANGEYDADFVSCVMWREQAERFASWTKKGYLVAIVGRIQTRNYEGTDGRRIYVTEVVAENFQILEKRDNSGNQNSMMEQMPPSYASNPMDISDDDLPF